jgi:3-oxoacyl-[acyl-carrier-protein] synthase-3
MKVFITAMGKFLPGEPVDNDTMEEYIGSVGRRSSRVRQRILKQNGISARHYAIDRQQNTLFSNAEMAALAARNAVEKAGLDLAEIDFLGAATSQGDLPLPGFASMVHGELKAPPCEIATLHGVCASGLMALKSAMLQVQSGDKRHAIACASEFPSRLFKSSRFEAQGMVRDEGLGFDSEFLRWMLSDGAGAAVLGPSPSCSGPCFEIQWIDLISFANKFKPCMYVGPATNGTRLQSWLDYPSYGAAEDAGAINLRQDVRMLPAVVEHAVQGLLQVTKKRKLNPSCIDWLVPHYSSHLFRDQSHELASKAGFDIPQDRWFTNLYSTGNVGSASIFILLEELLYSGRLQVDDQVLCLVPESGRFLFGYMLLKVVEGTERRAMAKAAPAVRTRNPPPQLSSSSDPLSHSLIRDLADVWFDLEDRLQQVPIVKKLQEGRFSIDDYQNLLFNLRQQVIDGSCWIARAASNITADYFPIRSAFIAHTSDEHKDFEMLERNYVSVGGNLDEIRSGKKNIGSEALSAYILQRAGRENPFDLIGAMFIIEGIGQRIAKQWGLRIQEVLGLKNEAVSFFIYHSESDIQHFHRLDLAISIGILTPDLVSAIVKCAKTTARLYVLQLEEMGNC